MTIKIMRQILVMTNTENHFDFENINVYNLKKYKFSKDSTSEIILKWHHNFYDGFLSGVCEIHNKKYWFQKFEDSKNSELWYRRFLLIELNQISMENVLIQHSDFQKYVGYHTDYNDNKREVGKLHPQEMWKSFYDKYTSKMEVDLTGATIIGYFEN